MTKCYKVAKGYNYQCYRPFHPCDSVGVTMGIDYQTLIKETVRLWYDYTGLRANSTLNTCIISDLYIS